MGTAFSAAIVSSSSRRACRARTKNTDTPSTIIIVPWKIRALFMLYGGFAVEEARRAPSTRTKMIANAFPLHHNRAALASAFLVNSTPSSKPIGSNDMEHIPMTTKIAYNAAVLFGQTAQIKENQPTATIGTRILRVMPSLWVKIRSNNGAVTIEAMMPESSKVAPSIPAVVSEYPMGSYKAEDCGTAWVDRGANGTYEPLG
jgi:hypothetical protein